MRMLEDDAGTGRSAGKHDHEHLKLRMRVDDDRRVAGPVGPARPEMMAQPCLSMWPDGPVRRSPQNCHRSSAR